MLRFEHYKDIFYYMTQALYPKSVRVFIRKGKADIRRTIEGLVERKEAIQKFLDGLVSRKRKVENEKK